MKKVFFLAITIMFFSSVFAQQFGVKVGFNSTTATAKAMGITASETIGGFYLGITSEFELSDAINLQPELQYVYVSKDNLNTSFIQLPVMFKYYATDELSLHAGPQISYELQDSMTDYTNLGIGLAAGLGYDFSENFYADARYSMDLNNHYTGSADYSAKYSGLQIGVGYKF